MKYSNNSALPNNFLAEEAILNILLTNSFLIKEVTGNLKAESFYFEPHKIIYETILTLLEENKEINFVLLITYLQDKNLLTQIGGIERITTLLNRFENFSDLDEYIRLVNEKYIRRSIIEIGKQMILWGYTSSENLETIFERIEQAIFSLNEENVYQKIYSAAEVIDDVFLEMKAKIKKSTPPGLLTSFKDLDSILQGFQKSDLIILAGRPSMGKTAFALNLGQNIVEKHKIPLIIFTLEMSRQQIMYRFLSTHSNINANRLKSGKMDTSEWQHFGFTMQHFSKLPIFIDDNPNLTLSDIRSKLRKIFNGKIKKGVVIIDYLQLMKSNLKLDNRVQEISYLTRNLKIIAKEFEIPIIVLSQLSRSVESRTNKRPMLSDLRESGCFTPSKKKVRVASFDFQNLDTLSGISWNSSQLINKTLHPLAFKGIKPTFLVTFENGTHISLTSNHKILSKRGWVRISQLHQQEEIYCLIQNHQTFQKKEYQYHKIVNIHYEGLNQVYDKTIPFFHNYINNNIIFHNSIEQDADIVIMLYRAGYYMDKNSDSQPSETEFIVAKHRNGQIGTAKLFFQASTTKFTNNENE